MSLAVSPPPPDTPTKKIQSQAVRKDFYNPKKEGNRDQDGGGHPWVGGTRSGWTPKHGHGFGELNEVLAEGLQFGFLARHLRGPGLHPRVLADEVGEAEDSKGTEGRWVRRGRCPGMGGTQRWMMGCITLYKTLENLGLAGDASVDLGVSLTMSMCLCDPMSPMSHVSCSCVPLSLQMWPCPCPHMCPRVPTRAPMSLPAAGDPQVSGQPPEQVVLANLELQRVSALLVADEGPVASCWVLVGACPRGGHTGDMSPPP